MAGKHADQRPRAPRIPSNLRCFLIHRDAAGPVGAQILNESQSGCLVEASKGLPTRGTVSVLVSGSGPELDRVRRNQHIFHATVVRIQNGESAPHTYGLAKIESSRRH